MSSAGIASPAADRIGDGAFVENVPGRVSHLGEDPADLAVPLALAVVAAPIGHFGQTRQRRDRSVDDAENAAEGDLRRVLEKLIAAELAAPADQDAVALQVEKDLLEKLLRDRLLVGDVGDEDRLALWRLRERNKGSKCVFGLLGDHGAGSEGPARHAGTSRA